MTDVRNAPEHGPLRGLRIIDITNAWAGPMAGRILAFLGADVIHVEGPARIDGWRGAVTGGDVRRYPDFQPGERPYDRNNLFNGQNHGKRGLCVDLKQPAGLQILHKLVAISDALVANYTPGTLARLGLGPDVLAEINPQLVVIEMPGFGNSGPMTSQVALGPTMEAASGMAHFVGYGDGEPHVTGQAYLDPVGAYNSAATVLTALLTARRGDPTRWFELAQTEGAMRWIGEKLLSGIVGDEPIPAVANEVPYAEPHAAFRCAGDDEWVTIGIRNDTDWQHLAAAMGDAAPDPSLGFDDLLTRYRQREQLHQIIEDWTTTRQPADVAQRMQEYGVPAAPVLAGGTLAARQDLHDVGFFRELTHDNVGTHEHQGLPFRYDERLLHVTIAAPTLGQHNEQILTDLLGYSEQEYAELVEARTITSTPDGV